MKKTDLVVVENNTPITTSRIVAEKFGKTHRHVLEAIREIINTAGGMPKIGHTPMFAETVWTNEQNGQSYPMFEMTRDGFSLLAMGFTGKKALQFKLKFIDAFNRMEQALSAPQIERDARWFETRLGTKNSHRSFTDAIKMMVEYLESRGQQHHDPAFVYGSFTNLIQKRCDIKRGQRDNAPVACLNKLDQIQAMVANVIVKLVAGGKVLSLAEFKANVILQLDALDSLLGGNLPLIGGAK